MRPNETLSGRLTWENRSCLWAGGASSATGER
jgi:hypothetical protein